MPTAINDNKNKLGCSTGFGFFGECLLTHIMGNVVARGVCCFSFVPDHSRGEPCLERGDKHLICLAKQREPKFNLLDVEVPLQRCVWMMTVPDHKDRLS